MTNSHPRTRSLFYSLLCACLLVSLSALARAQNQPVALFYMTNSPGSVRSFLAHSKKIGILVPTWYSVDASGLVAGAPIPEVLRVAHQEIDLFRVDHRP